MYSGSALNSADIPVAKVKLQNRLVEIGKLTRLLLREDKYILPMYLIAALIGLLVAIVYCLIEVLPLSDKVDHWIFFLSLLAMYLGLSIPALLRFWQELNLSEESRSHGKRIYWYSVADAILITLATFEAALVSVSETTMRALTLQIRARRAVSKDE